MPRRHFGIQAQNRTAAQIKAAAANQTPVVRVPYGPQTTPSVALYPAFSVLSTIYPSAGADAVSIVIAWAGVDTLVDFSIDWIATNDPSCPVLPYLNANSLESGAGGVPVSINVYNTNFMGTFDENSQTNFTIRNLNAYALVVNGSTTGTCSATVSGMC